MGVRAFSEFGAFGAYERLGLAGLRRWWTFGAWAASAVGRRGGGCAAVYQPSAMAMRFMMRLVRISVMMDIPRSRTTRLAK